MSNSDKTNLIDEGIRNAAMRLHSIAERGRSGQFSCPEMELAASAIMALRERAERAEQERDQLLDSYVNLGTREDARRFFGLAAPPASDPAAAGLVAAFGLSGEATTTEPAIDPETLDGPRSGASEGEPPRQDGQEGPQDALGRVPEG
jgi:hypothetical protein